MAYSNCRSVSFSSMASAVAIACTTCRENGLCRPDSSQKVEKASILLQTQPQLPFPFLIVAKTLEICHLPRPSSVDQPYWSICNCNFNSVVVSVIVQLTSISGSDSITASLVIMRWHFRKRDQTDRDRLKQSQKEQSERI